MAVPVRFRGRVRRVDLIVDAEGVHRSSRSMFEPNAVRYEPRFDNGGGINVFLSDRVSLEVKVAALESRLHGRNGRAAVRGRSRRSGA